MSETSLQSDGQGRWVLIGAWNFPSAGELQRHSARLLGQEPPEIIDLQEITQMDSAGLALLIGWIRDLQANGQQAPRFINIPAQLRSIAELYAVDNLLT